LPASEYLEPARAAAAATLFTHSWQFVCHAADLPSPGTAARLDCAGRSVFVLRAIDGELHAFRNACRHRGARLIDGDAFTGLAFCIDARVRCPFHGWTYDDAGRLIGVPGAEHYPELDLATHGLHATSVEQWRGLVFVAFDPPEESLCQRLDGLFTDWPHLGAMRRLGEPTLTELECDWKVACEHLLDGAHATTARPRPTPRVFESPRYTASGRFALEATSGLANDGDRASWSVRTYGALASAAQAEPQARYLYLWPNQRLSMAPDGVRIAQVLPGKDGRSTLREVTFGTPGAARELRLMRYARQRVEREARRADARMLARVQHGLASLPPEESGPVDDREVGLRWFVERYREVLGEFSKSTTLTQRRRARSPRRSAAPAEA
jgi:phenylpropionate dioxygenase-like ring-hydroxylating dioxygenase large terminal subunit